MAAAVAHVRKQLGPDAVILHTRTVKTGGLFGIGARQQIEITASADANIRLPRKNNKPHSKPGPGTGTSPRPATPERAASAQDHERTGCTAAPPVDNMQLAHSETLRNELQQVRSMVEDLVKQNRRSQHPEVPEELFTLYLSLIQQEVAAELADEVIQDMKSRLTAQELSNTEAVARTLVNRIENLVPSTGGVAAGHPGKPRVVALIGPTGVGKTTTVAKLAANFKLREQKKVGLITIDTYRIAAVDQLRTYASIIDVPLKVVLTPDELRSAIDEFKDNHVIFVDTAGRSPNDALRLNELKSFLEAANPHEVHLVLSCTSNQNNLMQAVDRFGALGVDKIIFTKLDEAVHFGVIINVISKVNKAMSYVTTGQNVPDDIEVSHARRLARLILESCKKSSQAQPGKSGRASDGAVVGAGSK